MKVIDLLNKIANGEEVPEEIKYEDTLYNYEENYKDYRKFGTTDLLFEEIFKVNVMPDIILNTEIEIIEEEKYQIEKLTNVVFGDDLMNEIGLNRLKINEIIDVVNKLNNKEE